MSAIATATVLDHSVERLPGTVHFCVTTDRGKAVLSFTPAEAQLAGRALARGAVEEPPVNHSTAASRGLPLLKPHGGVA